MTKTLVEVNATLPEGFRVGMFLLDDEGEPMTTPVSLDVLAHHSDLTPDEARTLGYALIFAAEHARSGQAGEAPGGQPAVHNSVDTGSACPGVDLGESRTAGSLASGDTR